MATKKGKLKRRIDLDLDEIMSTASTAAKWPHDKKKCERKKGKIKRRIDLDLDEIMSTDSTAAKWP
jgi:hypothetical protein